MDSDLHITIKFNAGFDGLIVSVYYRNYLFGKWKVVRPWPYLPYRLLRPWLSTVRMKEWVKS